MEERSRIRFNPATREIEIEGSEEFVRIYFGKVQKLLLAHVGGKEEKPKPPRDPSGGEAEKDEEKNRPKEGPEEGSEGNPLGLGRQAHPRQRRGNHDGGAKGKDWARRESDLEHRLPGRETGKNQKDKTGDLHGVITRRERLQPDAAALISLLRLSWPAPGFNVLKTGRGRSPSRRLHNPMPGTLSGFPGPLRPTDRPGCRGISPTGAGPL